jgi:hypothetical protein
MFHEALQNGGAKNGLITSCGAENMWIPTATVWQ